MRQKELSKERDDKGWNPASESGEEALTNEERSLDIGKSGQFAPGGYYNQQTMDQPQHRPVDDDVVPAWPPLIARP